MDRGLPVADAPARHGDAAGGRMVTGLAQRLRAMSRDEVAWRLRTQLRTHSDEAACAIRTPRRDRADIPQALANDTQPSEMQTAIAAADWRAVHAQLGEALPGCPSPLR